MVNGLAAGPSVGCSAGQQRTIFINHNQA